MGNEQVTVEYEHFDACPECHGKKISYTEEGVFCKGCGLCLEDTIFVGHANIMKDGFCQNSSAHRSSLYEPNDRIGSIMDGKQIYHRGHDKAYS